MSKVKEIFDCKSINYFFQHIPSHSKLNFSCLHINIRSLIKNFTKLLQVIHSCSFPLDVIIVTEAGSLTISFICII